MPGTGTDEETMRRIVREEAKAAANEAVEGFLYSKIMMVGSALAGLMKGGQMVCAFCGTPQSKAGKMIGSAHGLHMCDQCVTSAHQHMNAKK